MRILDNYILKSIIVIFCSTILVFCFLYILIDIAGNLSEIIDRKVPFNILVAYYSSFLPIIFVHTSPIACLIATLLTFGRLNNQNEIIVLRTTGLNFWQIIRPALWFTVLVAVFIFWLNEQFVPKATISSQEIKNENLITKADSENRKKSDIKNLTFYGLKNRLYFIDSFNPNTYELKGITIIGQDNNQNIKEKIVALRGTWTGIAWKFHQCQVSKFNTGDILNPEKIEYLKEKLMDIKETPQDFLRQRLNVTSMNIRQLHDYIKRFENSGATKALNNLRVDLHQKIAFPFGILVIVLVGMPLALMTGRRKAAAFTSIGIAVMIGFLFYVVNAVGLALGKGGMIYPMLSAWLAPAVFLLVAIYLIETKFN